MKKIFLTVLALFLTASLCFAQENNAKKNDIVFIYMNGSNSNTEESMNNFLKDVDFFHPYLKSAFDSSDYAVKYFLRNGEYEISPKPIAFYWGDKSKDELGRLDKELMIASFFSPKLAQNIRSFFAHCMHDAIWVQKPHNMNKIIDDLHTVVKKEEDSGNKVVLLGYSAGSFITYQYIFTKFPYIIYPSKIFKKSGLSQENKDFLCSVKTKPTCIDALVDLDLIVIGTNGRLVPIENESVLREKYLSLDKQTELSCTSSDVVTGIINFGSPLVLFYPDLSDSSFDLNIYNRLLYEYIIEHDFFWITTNYREDPLGFPSATNLSVDDISKILGLEISPRLGFLFDRSDLKSSKSFVSAHLSYWRNAKKLSKDMVNTYEIARRYYYGDK